MKYERWMMLLFWSMAAVDCRAQYIGAEECNGSESSGQGGKGGTTTSKGSTGGTNQCPACTCEAGAGGEPGAQGGMSGEGATGATGGDATAGQGGAGGADACAAAPSLPEPDLYIPINGDCAETELVAKLGPRYAWLGYSEITGTVDGAPLTCDTGYDNQGSSASFDGSQQVKFTEHTAIDMRCDETVSVHVRSSSDSQDAGVFGRWYLNDQFGLTINLGVWNHSIVRPDPRPEFWEEDPDDPPNIRDLHEFGEIFKMGTAAVVNEWVHLVMVVECGRALRLYKNGVLTQQELQLPGEFIFQATKVPFVIGRLRDGVGPAFVGAIDEYRLYHRALSAEQVALLECIH